MMENAIEDCLVVRISKFEGADYKRKTVWHSCCLFSTFETESEKVSSFKILFAGTNNSIVRLTS